MICKNCGTEFTDEIDVCPACGTKSNSPENVPEKSQAAEPITDAVLDEKKPKKKTALAVIIAASAIAIVGAVFFTLIAPKIFVSVEELCAKGDYEKAYEKAEGSEKEDVIAENNVAVCTADTVEFLKDPDSFELRNAWYYDNKNESLALVALKYTAKNAYGGTTINYSLYSFDRDESSEWDLYDFFDSDMEPYRTFYEDEENETIVKVLDNICRKFLSRAMNEGQKLDGDAVDRINDLFEQDLLSDVDQLDEAKPKK